MHAVPPGTALTGGLGLGGRAHALDIQMVCAFMGGSPASPAFLPVPGCSQVAQSLMLFCVRWRLCPGGTEDLREGVRRGNGREKSVSTSQVLSHSSRPSN